LTTLTETVDGVIGVDTHRDTLAAAAVTAIGASLGCTEAFADAGGYRRLFQFAHHHLPDRRCWAIEGTSSYGAGLTEFLIGQGERVVEGLPAQTPTTAGRRQERHPRRCPRRPRSPYQRPSHPAAQPRWTRSPPSPHHHPGRRGRRRHRRRQPPQVADRLRARRPSRRNCAAGPATPRSPTAPSSVIAPPATLNTAPPCARCAAPPGASRHSQ
jgi:hypothetical protein